MAAECDEYGDDGDSERSSPTHAALGLSTTPTSSVAASEAKKKKKKEVNYLLQLSMLKKDGVFLYEIARWLWLRTGFRFGSVHYSL